MTSVGSVNSVNSQNVKLSDLKRTHLSAGEADFQTYFNTLMSTAKGKELVKSLGGDKNIQNVVAQLYKENNVLSFDALENSSYLRSAGIKVSASWVSGVDHMADEKATGNSKQISHSGITVITFTDASGKTFKVADANGNAALESEELMFNDILGGISSDLGAQANGQMSGDIETTNGIKPTDGAKDSFFSKSVADQEKARLASLDEEENKKLKETEAEEKAAQAERDALRQQESIKTAANEYVKDNEEMMNQLKQQQSIKDEASTYAKNNNVNNESALTMVLAKYGYHKVTYDQALTLTLVQSGKY